jgi:hypothetical protein
MKTRRIGACNLAKLPESILSGLDSLSLLTTSHDFNRQNLSTFWATSPATAQAAGMAGTLAARHPDFWPETIRALMIRSAEWTAPMLKKIRAAANKKQKVILARHFGYGVPSLARAFHVLGSTRRKPLYRNREHDYALSFCVRELYQVPPSAFTGSFPFGYWTFLVLRRKLCKHASFRK